VINIFWFHHTVQKSQAEWDAPPNPRPPLLPWSKAALPLAAAVVSFGAIIASIMIHPFFDGTLVLLLIGTILATIASLVWVLQVRKPSYPPLKVRLSGAASLTCWLLVIIFGRLIAYDWFNCEKTPEGSLVYFMEECAQKLEYLNDQPADGETPAEGETPAADGETPPTDAAPADGAAPVEGAAPAEPAPAEPAAPAPATPAPGKGG
jgi:hypothetical protein